MVNCLAGCIKDYLAPGRLFFQASEIDAENISPIIKAEFSSTGGEKSGITVGNESYPYRKNKACIKSIQFGVITETEGSLEIIDEEGGAFSIFIDNLQKCAIGADSFSNRSTLRFQVGWVYSPCNNPFIKNNVIYSPIVESTIQKIVSNISNGVIRFSITFLTYSTIIQNSRENVIFGEQVGNKSMTITEAINQLAAIEPRLNVRYARYNDSGKLIYLEKHKWVGNWLSGEPKSAWQADNLNRYSVIQKWVEPFTVDNGSGKKGVIVLHSPDKPDEILILEDPTQETVNSNMSIGTFIVNGGNCSNVLEFSPSLDFITAFSAKATGGSTDPNGSSNQLKKDQKDSSKDPDNLGTQQTIVVSQQAQAIMGKEASINTNFSQNKHSSANKIVDISFAPISDTDLRIVGTVAPEFYSLVVGKSVSIIVINPFHIESSKNQCGDYLKRSSCHPIFSNKSWQIRGVSHSIQDGSFVTILKVYMTEATIKINIPCK